MQKASTTVVGIPNTYASSGIGHAYLPSGVDRDSYVAKCLRDSRVAVRDAYSGAVVSLEAFVPEYLMGHLRIPSRPGRLGSQVLYNLTDTRQVCVVSAVLRGVDSGGDLSDENQQRLASGEGANRSTLSLNGAHARLQSDGEASTLSLAAFGEDSGVSVASGRDIVLEALRRRDRAFAKAGYYDDKWHVLRDGTGEAAEPAVLGDTAKEKLDRLCDLVEEIATLASRIVVPTPVGPSGVPNNTADFARAASEVSRLRSELPEILSPNLDID